MNRERYKEVLETKLIPFMQIHQATHFLQDGAPCHTSKKIKDLLKAEDFEVIDQLLQLEGAISRSSGETLRLYAKEDYWRAEKEGRDDHILVKQCNNMEIYNFSTSLCLLRQEIEKFEILEPQIVSGQVLSQWWKKIVLGSHRYVLSLHTAWTGLFTISILCRIVDQ